MTDEVVAAAQFVMNDFQRSEAGLVDFPWAVTCAETGRRITTASHFGICPAISPQHTVDQIGGSVIYERYFMGKWRALWEQKQAAFPDQYDFSAMSGITSIQTLTELFIADHTQFSDRLSTMPPTIYAPPAGRGQGDHLAAADDPIIPPQHYDALPPRLALI